MSLLRNDWFSRKAIVKCLKVLPKRDRNKVLLVILIQLFLSILDLLGIGLVGVLGALAISGVESQKPGNRVSAVLKLLQLQNISFQNAIIVIGVLASLILVSRTFFSIYLTRKTLFFLSRKGAVISGELTSKLLSKSLLYVQRRTNQHTAYALTSGVDTIVLKIIGSFIMIVADASILVVMLFGLLVVDSLVAISTFLFFGLIGLLLYKLMHRRAQDLGRTLSQLGIKSNETIVEVLTSYRESTVRNRRFFYARKISSLQMQAAETSAEMVFMPNVSKYVIETTVVLGALLIAGVQFMLKDAVHAVSTLSVFLAAGTRIAPASLRLQQGALQMKSAIGSAAPTLNLSEELGPEEPIQRASDELDLIHYGFNPEVKIQGVSLTYPEKEVPSVRDVSLEIKEGTIVAIVGASGAGKTSLVDLILGVIAPSSGTVQISGCAPEVAISKWPGAISYVPQDVATTNGSVRENVALGFPENLATDDLVYSALRIANLEQVINEMPYGLDTEVGERGTKLSGGQRQRLGIARAVYTKPALLVLDEATSALDGETEIQITEAINKLKGSTTIIIIAHRLSTVREADLVVYMEQGKIVASGTFDELRSKVANFDNQARLMGL